MSNGQSDRQRGKTRTDKNKAGPQLDLSDATDVPDPMRQAFDQLGNAEALRMQGKAKSARKICEALVGRHPMYFGALYTLGLIYIELNQYPQALGCLVRAVMLNPRSWRALTTLSAVYLELGASEMAARTLEQATEINPDDPNILITLGEIYRQEREYELARDAYKKSFDLDPSMDAAGRGLGACYADLGQYAESAAVFEDLLRRGDRSTAILSELNNLPSVFVNVDLLSALQQTKRGPNQQKENFENTKGFARAAILHKAGRYSEAWDDLLAANATMHRIRGEEVEITAGIEQANLAQLRKKAVRVKAGSADEPNTISLFILGTSRSGKTTAETLVDCLDGVKRGYENPSIENAIRRTFQSAGLLASNMFEVLPPKLDSECCKLYLEELHRRAGSARIFTNTHPGRIHDAARVAAAIPNVRFIFVKRNIEDAMLRIFMRKYRLGNLYAYDLKSIKDHIIWYHEMIDVLAEKLPDIARVIQYEDMITDPTSVLEVAAKLCGLDSANSQLPEIGDDRGFADPYKQFVSRALSNHE